MSQGWRDTLQWLKCLLCSRLTPVLISNTTANHPGVKRRERGVLGSPIRHSLKTSKDNYISQSISKDIIFKNIFKKDIFNCAKTVKCSKDAHNNFIYCQNLFGF